MTSASAGSGMRHPKLSSLEENILSYVLNFHAAQTHGKPSAFITLLIHSKFLAKGMNLEATENASKPISSQSILPLDWTAGDLIRLNYGLVQTNCEHMGPSDASAKEYSIQLSVAETDGHIYISLTNNTTDKFAHVEFVSSEHIRPNYPPGNKNPNAKQDFFSDEPLKPSDIFTQLEETSFEIDEKLLNIVIPAKSASISETSTDRSRSIRSNILVENRFIDPSIYGQRNIPISSEGGFPEYGRSDLDPMGGGGMGGMLLDPNRMPGMSGSRFIDPFIPPNSVPPGARFDPIGPRAGPGRGRNFRPDPDHAMPPGFDDMYL